MVAWFYALNKVNPDVDGLTKEEFFEYGASMYAKLGKKLQGEKNFEELVSKLASEQFEWFKALSQEDKNKIMEESARRVTSEGIMARNNEFNSIWSEADTDNDELLDRAGLKDFYLRENQALSGRGVPVFDYNSYSDQQWDDFFNKLNAYNSAHVGIACGDKLQLDSGIKAKFE